MFQFTRDNTEYTVDFATGASANLVLCTYIQDDKVKWLVVRDTDDLSSTLLYPDQNAIQENATIFMFEFIKAINKELDKRHTPPTDSPTTAVEWVDYIINYEMTFNGEHLLIRGKKEL